jgi:phosphoribosylamine--glycine ligase
LKVLLLGSGGRESALAWALDRSRVVSEIVAAPGNPGIGRVAELETVDPEDPEAVVGLARRVRPGLVVVGPEAPLVAGVGDALRAEGFDVFGPDAAAARIEGSKAYSKELMDAAGIPTAKWQRFEDVEGATRFLDELGPPYVVKADGLAAGKGVVVTEDRSDAIAAIEERLVERKFGDAGSSVVIEEFLDGEETSLIAFTDGTSIAACEPAQDYKRVGDGDSGPNTGGMGSYSPVPACPADVAVSIVEQVIRPMVDVTAERGAPFVGALYAGLALTSRGPKVVEFNARFGDPETQALLPRMGSDLGEVALACARGELEGTKLEWRPEACVSVVLAANGYPGSYPSGERIEGLEIAEGMDNVAVFHAGTRSEGDAVVTAGGRVLAVSALGTTFKDARARAYEAAGAISFSSKYLRSDIAQRAVDGAETEEERT